MLMRVVMQVPDNMNKLYHQCMSKGAAWAT